MSAIATRPATPIAETVRKVAVAAFEALPALLLAAALLMPALVAFAGRSAGAAAEPTPVTAPATTEVGRAIADQGNRALIEIRQDARESLRESITLPKLS